jgi:hypothetical protein
VQRIVENDANAATDSDLDTDANPANPDSQDETPSA